MLEDDNRYARSGDFIRWIEKEDVELDAAIRDKMGRIGRLDDLARAIAAAPAKDSPFENVLIVAAATTAWDEARRLSGLPELCVANQKASSPYPFQTLGAALAFHENGHPGAIGAGSLTVPSVQDRKEDLTLRTLYKAWGIETMASHPSRCAPDADPKGVKRLDLWLSVDSAIMRARPWEAHKAALSWIRDMVIGRAERTPKARRLGAHKGAPHRRQPQYEHVRARIEDTTVDGTHVEGIATRAQESIGIVRTAVKIARGRIIDELVRSELLSPDKPKRKARPIERRPNVFADW